jgi:excisionase family DNA binding protein
MEKFAIKEPEEKFAVTVREAAKLLSIGLRKMEQLVREKQIRTVLVGRRRVVPVEELKRFLRADQ